MSESQSDPIPEPGAPLPLSRQALAARPHPYLDGLNPAQRAAVEALDGPVLMLAGAGTGKTRALTTRIAHLLFTGRARPGEILAVTFTNKAAREMKSRVGRLLGETVEGMPWLGTFHAIGARLLRRHAELVGLKSSFTILDTDDQLRLLRQLIQAANIDEKRHPARLLAGLIDGWKNRALRPEQVPPAEAGAFGARGSELYAAYQARLRTLNAVDFGDLLLHCLTLLRANPDVLERYQQRFRYILVDEYQDTNIAQYLWLRLLAQAHHNICCVGDDDQSIYGWRGAEVGNILRFEKDFPGAQVIRLEQNYRSTPHILAAASGLIAQNRGRLGKTLWTERPEGLPVRLIGHWDGEEEARWIGEEIEALSRGAHGLPPLSLEGCAILVRASHQMRAFEDRFLSIGLPYRVIGGPRFYERLEIRDAMAYFRLVVSPDDDLAFERIVNTPKRGLGEKGQQQLQALARARGLPLLQAARLALAEGMFGGRARAGLGRLLADLERWQAEVRAPAAAPDPDAVIEAEEPPPAPVRPAPGVMPAHVALAAAILEESGYVAMWQADRTPEAEGRLENLKELLKALEAFQNLQGFLEHVALVMDNEGAGDEAKVSIMTLHAAKGLEFPAVFLPGWEDGLFPNQRALDEGGTRALEEERRLAYVGLTRAERLCTVSFASNRRVYGQWQSALPSRFIDELPPAHIEVLTAPGLNGAGFGAAGPARAGGPASGPVSGPVSGTAGGAAMEDRASRADVYNSPGWRRLQARAARPASAAPARSDPARHHAEPPVFAVGARVFHQKFGYGRVQQVEGDKLDIAFEKAGQKKVVAQFVVDAPEAAADTTAAGDVPF